MITGVVASGVATTAAFSPANIAGLQFWFKADGTLWQDSARTTPATANDHPVGSWDDASSNSRHATQATAGARPLLKTNALNGQPVIHPDAVNDKLATGVVASLVQPITMFIVQKWDTSTGTVLATDGETAANRCVLAYKLVGFFTYFAGVEQQTATSANTNWNIHMARFNGASSTYRLNGTSISTANPGTGGLTGLSLFANRAGTIFANADIAEVIVYNAALSNSDLNLVGNYLKTKYALTWTDI